MMFLQDRCILVTSLLQIKKLRHVMVRLPMQGQQILKFYRLVYRLALVTQVCTYSVVLVGITGTSRSFTVDLVGSLVYECG